MREVAEIIGQHHERLDGTGYPKGLRANEIRIEAQILSVCDAFASMRTDRPYRPGLSEEESRSRLLAGRGTQLAAPLVDLFVRFLDRDIVGHLGQFNDHSVLAPDAPTFARSIEKLQVEAN
jgi:HD-GYP domain-containing protein (c-di-GMP phosphodiesterase class II)